MSALPMAADFGPLVAATDIDFAVIRTLRLWLPTYLAELERDRNLANRTLMRPLPTSYTIALDDEEFREGRFPAITVATSALDADPEMDGAGVYSAGWNIIVATVVRGEDSEQAKVVAALFGAAVRHCLTQQSNLGGFASETRPRGGEGAVKVADSTGQDRFLVRYRNPFTVYVDALVQTGVGPYAPDPDDPYPYEPPDPSGNPDAPYDPLVPVDTVTVDVVPKPDEE